MGLQVVNDTLANNYIRPDEFAKATEQEKRAENTLLSTKAKVRLVDLTMPEGVNFNNKFLHSTSEYVRDYEGLLMGGVWAQVDMRFETDEEFEGQESILHPQARPEFKSRLSTSTSTAMSGSSSRPTSGWISLSGAWAWSPAKCLGG